MPQSGCYPEKAPKIDTLLDTLSHHIRREVIHYFENLRAADTAAIDELVAHITRRVPDEDRESTATALVHVHLPKLEDAGWLKYDQGTQVCYHGKDSVGYLLGEVCGMFNE